MKKLTKKQLFFVDEYIIDFNATQAAIRAGYAKKRADQIGYENLMKPEIQALLKEKIESRRERLRIESDEVLRELARLAFYNVLDMFNDDGSLKLISEIKRNLGAAIHGLEVVEITKTDEGTTRTFLKKFKFHAKDKALDALAKHLGLFERDNKQKGNADLKTRKEFIEDLLAAVDGQSLGLPGERKSK